MGGVVPAEEVNARKRARRAIGTEELSAHTVESYLTLQRDKLVQEMDALTGALVQELHEACTKAKASLRAEFGPEAQVESPETYTLTMTTTAGPHVGAKFTLSVGPESCFIGRSSGKKFRLKGVSLPKDNEVSTTHAKIELQRGQLVIVDVGSTNGTILDGVELDEAKPYPLEKGTTIHIGSSKFHVDDIKK
ncbi:hypothetical protein CTAYLR_005030 [Chrysophaeum taylorii]|uniref:FHA domain-containing protein n=1 Tax=Chrysophaeum taylorii TaxID=2483200 RepID=A0AAD7UBI3_9STRA|nr:hypothetical protein CTAYLR_005030 [Chrysophaeum taylorii]